MSADADRRQRVRAGVVMIEAASKPFARAYGQIELEPVSSARRRIRSHGVTTLVEVELGVRSLENARRPVKKLRQLGEGDRSLTIKAARRMALAQELCDWRDCLRRRTRDLAQIDCLSRPARPNGGQRGNDAGMRIGSAQRIGVPAFGAARVEQKIMKVPKSEALVALGRSKSAFAGCGAP